MITCEDDPRYQVCKVCGAKDCDCTMDMYYKHQIKQLTAERDRLRAALEKAANAFWKLDNADIHAQEAEEALKGQP